jgi:hypothetical protein
VRALLEREAPDRVQLAVGVAGEPVHGHDRPEPEAADVGKVPLEVRGSDLDRLEAAVRIAAVVLERADGRDEHDRARLQASDAADDVQELLHAHVGAEPALRHDVVAELEPDQVGDERVVPVRDVREGAAVDQRRLTFEGLYEVRLDRVLQQDRHGASRVQVVGGDGLTRCAVADRDCAQPSP